MSNWVNSAQERDYWRALVNAALNLRIYKLVSNLLLVKYADLLMSTISRRYPMTQEESPTEAVTVC